MIEGSEMTIEQVRNEILKFKNDPVAQKLSEHYTKKSVGEIYGNSRKELTHSSFIGWLLNPNESHGLGHLPLEKFLEIIVISCRDKDYEKHKALFDSVITGDLTLLDTSVSIEKSISRVGRLDLFIETTVKTSSWSKPIQIIIENKVQTKEHSDQTTSYANHFLNNSENNTETLLVFLTAISGVDLAELHEKQEVECSSDEFIQTNYQCLVDYLFEPILSKDIATLTKFILKDYLQTLSQPAFLDDSDDFKQDLIMAIGNEERQLLAKFWEQNQKLILSAIYAISTDPSQDVDTRETTEKLLSEISSGRDRSKIDIYLNDVLEVSGIIKANIGLKTVKLIESKGLMTEEAFNFFRNDMSCSFRLLKTSEEFTDNEIKYKKYRSNKEPELIFEGQVYYVARNWGITNIPNFIEACESYFPQLRFDVKQ